MINQFSVQNACSCFFFNLRFLFKMVVLLFVQTWLLIFLFKIDCYVCFFCWILIFLFKLIVDISVQIGIFLRIDCSEFCSNSSFIYLIKLIHHFSVQNACSCFCSNWLFIFCSKVVVDFSVQIDCWYIRSSWLFTFFS